MSDPRNPSICDLWVHLHDAPRLQIAFIVLFLVVSIIGGNAVFVAHNRRLGRPWFAIFNPFPLLKEFNLIEWTLLALVYLVSGAFAGLALLAG